MDPSVTIIRRAAKHARLRVWQDSRAEIVVPKGWKPEEVNTLLGGKAAWIQKKQAFFRSRERSRLTLATNELMLFGEAYRVDKDEHLDGGVEVDRVGRRLRVGHAFASDAYLRAWQQGFAKTFLSNGRSYISWQNRLLRGI